MSKKPVDARMSMFGRLAVESGLVSYDDIVACVEEQDRLRSEGTIPPKLGEIMVQRGILTELEVETILRMQSNPGGLIGRQLLEKGLVTREQLKEVLDEQAEYTRAGQPPPRIGELLVERGLIKRSDLELLLKKKETPGSMFGEFLVSNSLVKEEDINKCLAAQKESAAKGEKPLKLGELLVSCGVLRKDQMEIYSRRHLQARRQVAPATTASGGPVKRSTRKARGDFELDAALGHHVDGVTHRAVHAPSGAMVAVHFFSAAASPELEAAAAAKRDRLPLLRGRSVQMVYSSEDIGGQPAMAAQYIDGSTLEAVINDKGKIEWAWSAEVLHDITRALLDAEALGINHDDIRPSSILVDATGRAKLALWGYTRDPVANRDWLARKHHPLTFYFAPERVGGAPSARADMFSLGLTIIHALTGTPPLRANTAAEAAGKYSQAEAMRDLAIDMELPLGLLSILSRMVEPDPGERFSGHNQLLDELNHFMQDEGLDADTDRNAFLEAQSLTPDQANAAIARFLSTETAARDEKRASFTKLASYYAGPIVAMLLIMIGITIIYRTTQASHGMMVRANWLDQQGDKANALTVYRIISTLYPTDEQVQHRYYELSLEMKDYGEAEIALERLMTLHPDRRLEYLESQADLQVWQRRFLSAVDLYREVAVTRPNDLALKTKIASALLWAKTYPEAEEEYKELAVLQPGDNSVLLGLARSAAGAGDVPVAAEAFDRLFRLNLLPETSLMEYAWLLKDAGRTQELGSLASVALDRKDSSDYDRKNLINLYNWAGRYEDAAKALDAIAATTPNDKETILFRININDRLGNVAAVMEDYKRLAELEPFDPQPLMTVARLYQGRDDFRSADAYFRQALGRDEDNPEIRRAIAENLSYMEDRTEAIRWYREALAKSPTDREAIGGLVQALLWNEEYAEAEKYVEQLYKDNPKDRTNRLNMALVYSRLGKDKEAIPLVESLIEEGALASDDKERLAMNAMASNSNELLLRLVGDVDGNVTNLTEIRLLLARRMRAEGRHRTALPLYAAVLAASPDPDPKLLVEMAETANWAGRHDVATSWLELARDVVAAKEAGRSRQLRAGPEGDRFRLTTDEWDSILTPLKGQPDVFQSLSSFKGAFGKEEALSAVAPTTAAPAPAMAAAPNAPKLIVPILPKQSLATDTPVAPVRPVAPVVPVIPAAPAAPTAAVVPNAVTSTTTSSLGEAVRSAVSSAMTATAATPSPVATALTEAAKTAASTAGTTAETTAGTTASALTDAFTEKLAETMTESMTNAAASASARQPTIVVPNLPKSVPTQPIDKYF